MITGASGEIGQAAAKAWVPTDASQPTDLQRPFQTALDRLGGQLESLNLLQRARQPFRKKKV